MLIGIKIFSSIIWASQGHQSQKRHDCQHRQKSYIFAHRRQKPNFLRLFTILKMYNHTTMLYVFTYIHVPVHVHAHVYVCPHLDVSLHVHVHQHVKLHVHIHLYMYYTVDDNTDASHNRRVTLIEALFSVLDWLSARQTWMQLSWQAQCVHCCYISFGHKQVQK